MGLGGKRVVVHLVPYPSTLDLVIRPDHCCLFVRASSKAL